MQLKFEFTGFIWLFLLYLYLRNVAPHNHNYKNYNNNNLLLQQQQQQQQLTTTTHTTTYFQKW